MTDQDNTLAKKVASMEEVIVNLSKKLELQDNNVPEFGRANEGSKKLEAADMSASERAEKLGDYGKWDACFK